MTFFTQLRAWVRRERRKRAAKQRKGTLREFVYLDEVSVYSLLSSRLGPLATEFTDTERASLKAELGGIGGNTEGGSQVLRKATVQTSFKEFYELEMNSLAIRPADQQTNLPNIGRIEELIAKKEILLADGWLIDPEDVVRGRLVELEVRLESEDIFRASSVVSVVLEIIDTNPEMFGIDPINLAQAKAAGKVLEKLLVGLVPVSGLAVDYKVIAIDNKEWFVHQRLLNQITSINSSSIYPLYIVGVAEQSLFWKDVRRVLFANARFRVLSRVSQDGIKNAWTPVKLAHILDLVKPGLGEQIDALGSMVLAAMITETASNQNSEPTLMAHNALLRYGTLLANHYGKSLTTEEMLKAGLPSEAQCRSFGTVEDRRIAFNEIADFVKSEMNVELDPLTVAQLRGIAMQEAGLDLLGRPLPAITDPSASPIASSPKRFLDCEFIAIYW